MGRVRNFSLFFMFLCISSLALGAPGGPGGGGSSGSSGGGSGPSGGSGGPGGPGGGSGGSGGGSGGSGGFGGGSGSDDVRVRCMIKPDSQLILSEYFKNPPNDLRQIDLGNSNVSVPQSDVDRKYIGMRVYCHTDKRARLQLRLETRGRVARSCSGGRSFCVVSSEIMPLPGQVTISSQFGRYREIGRFLLKRQQDFDEQRISSSDIRIEVEKAWNSSGDEFDDIDGERFSLSRSLRVTGSLDRSQDETPYCEVVVSGALGSLASGQVSCGGGSGCSAPSGSVMVRNGELYFNAVVKGVSGEDAAYSKYRVRWSGGPSQQGVWKAPTPGTQPFVMARVDLGQKGQVECGIKINVLGKPFLVNLRQYMSCGLYDELRRYYFFDDKEKLLKRGYKVTKNFPGIDATYGKPSAEVPFKGVFNAMAADNGQIVYGAKGNVIRPPLKHRRFSEPIIVARPFFSNEDGNDPKTSEVAPAYWGRIDLADMSKTELYPTGNYTDEFDADDLLVFQVFLARTQFSSKDKKNEIDIRGGTNEESIDLFNFISNTGSGNKGIPYDYFSLFAENSCFPMVRVSPPEINGKKISSDKWPAMKKSSMCAFSRPFKFSDFEAGRVSLKVLQVTPERADEEYPTHLMTTNVAERSCNAPEGEQMEECWNIPKRYMPSNAGEDPFKTHDQCRDFKYYYSPNTVCSDESKCRTVCRAAGHGRRICYKKCDSSVTCDDTNVKRVETVYKASCRVAEGKYCGRSLAIRFSGYTQNMVAALGCAVKYDRSGEAVSPTLTGQGILPYKTFGGSAPKHYTKYVNSRQVPITTTGIGGIYGGGNIYGGFGGIGSIYNRNRTRTVSTANKHGYACIPCRFESDMAKNGTSLAATTARLPVDQDKSAARKPIFTFSKSRAPKSCVRTQSFSVRYFGAAACGSKNPPKSAMCQSGNIPRLSCNTQDNQNPCPLGKFCGGGNDAGRFKVKVCPGSGFAYDKVAVSWSPLVLDIAGTGMEVSRSVNMARSFDMKGKGQKTLVDWPINTEENGFLVRPDEKGQVTSIRQLFGDFDAENGFQSLQKWDSNKDGQIDAADEKFAELKIWRDVNRDAVAQADEIEELSQHGVERIFLTYQKSSQKGVAGRELYGYYYNSKQQRFMNVVDQYFQEYLSAGDRRVSSSE